MDILNKKGIRSQSINGVRYVYEEKPYWNKLKKQTRHSREYIGKLDADDRFIPNKQYLNRQETKELSDNVVCARCASNLKKFPSSTVSRSFFGATHLLDCIGERTNLSRDLEKVFDKEIARKIMSLAYFLVLENESSMYRFEKFAKTHHHPCGQVISSQRISDLFANITEAQKISFFKLRSARCLKEEYLAYDTTSISSYSEIMKLVKYGQNKDLENLPQINLALVFGEKSLTPVYYRKLPGNICDVATIRKLLIDMNSIGIKNAKFVLDRGFYSQDNIDALFRDRHKFIVACRSNTSLFKGFMDEIYESIQGFSNYSEVHDVYCLTKETRWAYKYTDKKGNQVVKNKVIFFHGYYDGERAEKEKTAFIKQLVRAKIDWRSGKSTDAQNALIESFFHITETSEGRVIENHKQDVIDAHMKKFGYFMLMSNHSKNAQDALAIYRNKDVVEKAFSNIKHRLDMKRAKVNSEKSLEGKLFVQFVALSYVAYIHQVMSNNNLYKNYSMSSLLDEIDVIELFKQKNKNKHFSEITKKQKEILKHFGAEIQNTL